MDKQADTHYPIHGLLARRSSHRAFARGRHAHFMAGILADKTREHSGIPEDFDVVTGLALGYLGDAAALPESLRDRELAPRRRRPLAELAFIGAWGTPTPFT